MSAKIFDGKEFAEKIENDLIARVKKIKNPPNVAIIHNAEHQTGNLFVNLKKKALKRIGATFEVYATNNRKREQYVMNLIGQFNRDDEIDGILVQLPISGSKMFNSQKVFNLIYPFKDIDGLGKDSKYGGATPLAIEAILKAAKVRKNYSILIVGHKGFVGGATFKHLISKEYTVDGIDRQIKGLGDKTIGYDVVVSATGKKELIKGGMIKKGAVVIDVGAPHAEVERNTIDKVASFVTPVPGGVGPVTIAMLLKNLTKAAEIRNKLKK